MKLEKELLKLAKTFKGHIIGIGTDDKFNDVLFKNKDIKKIDILTSLSDGGITIDNTKGDYLGIKDLRKHFKNKKTDYIICNYDHIKKYSKHFIKDSIYITKGTIYIYTNDVDDYLLIEKRYQRYSTVVETYSYDTSFLIKIYVGKTKNNLIKDKFYYVLDNISNLLEYLRDMITN